MSYVLGHSNTELARLELQGNVLHRITSRLLTCAGVEPGMRILDLGCGAGDVSMLAGTLVGSSGSVLGIDRNSDAVALAGRRAGLTEQTHVSFDTIAVENFDSAELFDIVIGRYVVMHQSEPVEFIRKAASLVKPGGALAFHEFVALDPMVESHPMVPLWDLAGKLLVAVLSSATPCPNAAICMPALFASAGLARPDIFCERPVGGAENSPMYRWASESLRSLLPHLAGEALPAALENIDTFEDRLRSEVLKAHSLIVGPMQIGVWTTI